MRSAAQRDHPGGNNASHAIGRGHPDHFINESSTRAGGGTGARRESAPPARVRGLRCGERSTRDRHRAAEAGKRGAAGISGNLDTDVREAARPGQPGNRDARPVRRRCVAIKRPASRGAQPSLSVDLRVSCLKLLSGSCDPEGSGRRLSCHDRFGESGGPDSRKRRKSAPSLAARSEVWKRLDARRVPRNPCLADPLSLKGDRRWPPAR